MHFAPCTPEKKKTFRVVENHCLQCVESIFVNLPQFVKSGLKLRKSKQVFLVFSLDLFGYFGPVSNLFVSVSPGGEHLGIFPVGYVPPKTPNWHPVLKKISPKTDTPF